ncbi:MAG: 3-dehydroquinate synthase [Thermoprotei archaeon]
MSWRADYETECGSTAVTVGEGALGLLSSLEGRKAVISTSSLKEEALELSSKLDARLYLLPDGERAKSIREATRLLRWLYEMGMTRQDWVVAFGGGTVSDVAGFVSSVYMRGTRYAIAPTTLLAAVDASIGGKNAINFAGTKNLVGTVRQPSLVTVDTGILKRLPERELKSGMAEVIKYALSLDEGLFRLLEQRRDDVLQRGKALDEVILRSIDAKMKVVEKDELDSRGIRIVLNLGHTFAHAIEAGSGFSVSHGFAVAAGISMECWLGNRLGITSHEALTSALGLLRDYGLPCTLSELIGERRHFSMAAALRALNEDKKLCTTGRVNVPFVTEIGSWKSVELPLEQLKDSFRKVMAQ